MAEKKIAPKAPEIVFFGLILVNFGPLKFFQLHNPPMSDAKQPHKIINKTIFRL